MMGNLGASAIGDLLRPLDHRIRLASDVERPDGLSQRPSPLWRACACQSSALAPKPRRVFTWGQAQIRRDARRRGKAPHVIDRGHEARRRHRTDARHRHEARHSFVGFCKDTELPIGAGNLFAHGLQGDEYALEMRGQAVGILE